MGWEETDYEGTWVPTKEFVGHQILPIYLFTHFLEAGKPDRGLDKESNKEWMITWATAAIHWNGKEDLGMKDIFKIPMDLYDF